ncbi:hypothetical protein LCGC14_3027890, partial [marine sediment metagenome]
TEINQVSIQVFELIKEELQLLAKGLFNDAVREEYKKERDYLVDYVWKNIESRMRETQRHLSSEGWAQLENIRDECNDLRWELKKND